MMYSLIENRSSFLYSQFEKRSKDETTICHLFEEQVRKNPNRIALSYQGGNLTYKTLNEKANQLAHYLREKGVVSETPVAISMDRSCDLIIGVLGILKAGGMYIPFEASLPTQRIQYILNDCKPTFILTQSNLWLDNEILMTADSKIVFYDEVKETILRQPTYLINEAKPNHLMYAIYTSGSTGAPKGVLIEHHSVLHLFEASEKVFHFSEEDTWTLFHAFHFDFSVWEIFGALLYGGRLVIVGRESIYDVEKFYRVLVQEKVTFLNLTPTVFHKLMEVDQSLKQPLNLRIVLIGGEALYSKSLLPWFQSHDENKPRLFNVYGITETTILSTYYPISKKQIEKDEGAVIGKPFSDRKIYVLDEHQRPVKANEVGELYTSGACLSREYLNAPNLTKQKFIKNPYWTQCEDHTRLYRSGDLVKWLPGGQLEYVGRLDDQIKIRGFRVELGEIKEKIEQYEGILQALVTVSNNTLQDQELVAYFTSKSHSVIDIIHLKKFLENILPYYMIPRIFIAMDEFPLTSQGKIDKKTLPDPNLFRRGNCQKIRPKTESEKRISEILSAIFQQQVIYANDNIFNLGCDSLRVLEILSQIRLQCGVDLSLNAILKNPTITDLAKLVEKHGFIKKTKSQITLQDAMTQCAVLIQPKGDKSPLFLIHPVSGSVIWYMQLAKYFDEERPVYGIQDPGLIMQPIPFKSVEEMAAFYIQIIKNIQPKGPYYLGGASAGSITSLEIAHQLLTKHEEVAFIGLLDGWAVTDDKVLNKQIFEGSMQRQCKAVEQHQQSVIDFKNKGELLLELQWNRYELLINYRTPILYTKLTLFKAIETLGSFMPEKAIFNHWEKYSALPVEVYRVPGNHETMFQEPHLAILGNKLNHCLQEIE